jgi:hypothetical protein
MDLKLTVYALNGSNYSLLCWQKKKRITFTKINYIADCARDMFVAGKNDD